MISWNGRVSFALVAAVVLSACGAGGGATPPGAPMPASASGKHQGKGRLVFRIRIPKHGHHHRRLVRGRDGKPRYVSAATQGLTLDLTGPTTVSETVSLLPNAQGCTSTLASTQCTLLVPGLTACPHAGNCYTASIATYDSITGCPSACDVSAGNELSANETIPFRVTTGQANAISATLDAIPYDVVLVPSANSTLNGSPYGGFTLSKCGSDQVNVFAIDADGNYILGAGAPVPSLQSDNSKLTVATPSPAAPNTFTISRSNTNLPMPGSTANLTATVTPLANSESSPVSSSPIQMTFDASTCGVFTEFNIATASSSPQGIALGADGNLWFTESSGNKIGRITPAGTVTEYSVGLSANSGLAGIAQGPDGNIWFTESVTGNAGMITTGTTITEYTDGLSSPNGIAAGPDGNLWISESGSSKIAQVDTGGGLDNEYATTTDNSGPNGITAGPDGNLWFTEGLGNRIGRVTPAGTITEFSTGLSSAAAPDGIIAGPDGNLWFTESFTNKIGIITTAGAISEFAIPGGGSPLGITAGADGNVYFTLNSGHGIGQIATDGSGTIVVFSTGLTASNAPNSITVGADDNLWFTDSGTGKIGRLQ
jgi:streptogramin lyase